MRYSYTCKKYLFPTLGIFSNRKQFHNTIYYIVFWQRLPSTIYIFYLSEEYFWFGLFNRKTQTQVCFSDICLQKVAWLIFSYVAFTDMVEWTFSGGWCTSQNLVGLQNKTHQGAKYLGFFSSRSLKTKEKYISFAQFVYFLREVCLLFNFWMIKFTIM